MGAKSSTSKTNMSRGKPEAAQPKNVEPTSVLFKAGSPQNIEGFWFNPYLIVEKKKMVMRGGKSVNAVAFLEASPWFDKIYSVVKGSVVDAKVEKPRDGYTREELLRFAGEQEIKVTTDMNDDMLYRAIFGGEKGTM